MAGWGQAAGWERRCHEDRPIRSTVMDAYTLVLIALALFAGFCFGASYGDWRRWNRWPKRPRPRGRSQ